MHRLWRFRLTTTFGVIALICVLFAWYVDHYRRYRADIVGVWYYPTPDQQGSGYWETLTIDSKGGFTKLQQYRTSSETYAGKYVVADDGLITFYVTSKRYDYGEIPQRIESFHVDAVFRCRVANDVHGYLLVVHIGESHSSNVRIIQPGDVDVRWQRCYTSMSRDEQNDARWKMLLQEIENIDKAR